jgi:hypothetical protein
MEASGYSPEDFGDEFEIWPENHNTFRIFQRFQNQWQWVAGMGGAVRVGLNIGVLPVFADRLALADDEYNDLLDDLQAMESAAIAAMNE